jgi:hypothetical protein
VKLLNEVSGNTRLSKLGMGLALRPLPIASKSTGSQSTLVHHKPSYESARPFHEPRDPFQVPSRVH